MIYKKDPKIKYTDMCIYIDTHIYSGDYDEEKVYKYLYFIISMLAHKAKFFKKAEDYENFSLYMATHIYNRLTNPKQFQLDENGKPKIEKIKSVLNYIKKIINPIRINYQQEFYDQSISVVSDSEAKYYEQFSLANKLSQNTSYESMRAFNDCFEDIVLTIRKFLEKNLPYKKDTKVWQNIYLSCLLSFINSITISNAERNRINALATDFKKIKALEKVYEVQSRDENQIILYHIDPKLKDFIVVLMRRLKSAIAKDLSIALHTYITSDENLKNILFSEINGNKEFDSGEEYY